MHRIICQQDLRAVTAACMMVKRSAFDKVGGFTEELAVAFNDIDFCMKNTESRISDRLQSVCGTVLIMSRNREDLRIRLKDPAVHAEMRYFPEKLAGDPS